MESHAQSVEDYLIEGLSFKLALVHPMLPVAGASLFSQPVEIPIRLAE